MSEAEVQGNNFEASKSILHARIKAEVKERPYVSVARFEALKTGGERGRKKNGGLHDSPPRHAAPLGRDLLRTG